MARLPSTLMILGFLSAGLVAASPEPYYDQESQNRNAQCSNDCLFQAWSEGYCVTDPACMCNDQTRREKYFCCMAKKCDATVFLDAMERSGTACKERGLPFTLDAEAVCGIKLRPVTSSSVTSTDASSTGSSSTASSTSSGSGAPETSSTGSQTNSGGASQTSPPAGSGVSSQRFMLSGVMSLVAASGMLLLW